MANKPIVSHKRTADKKTDKAKASRKPLTSPAPGQLQIEIDSKVKSLTPKDLLDAEKFAELQGQCNGANKLVLCLHHLLDFSGQERFAVLDFIANLHVRPTIVVKDGDKPAEDLLAVVLSLMPDYQDVGAFGRAKAAAMETVALLHPDSVEAACNSIRETMKARGITGVRVPDLIREAKGIAGQITRARMQAGPAKTSQLLLGVLPDAPVSNEVVVPPGWQLTSKGICCLKMDQPGEISCPLVIAGRGKDGSTGTEHICVAWLRDGGWHRRIVDREVLANAQKILALAAFGLPVTSNNARLLVQYLAEFESANIEHLPLANVSHRLGFQGDHGKLGFLWGRRLITASSIEDTNDSDSLTPDEWSSRPVHFQGADEGDEQIAAGFHAAGTYQGWCRAIQPVAPYPKTKLALYVALVPPLLPILRTSNFLVDYAGQTTGGKTTALRAGVSCFGNPDEESTNGRPTAMFTWKATSVWRERAPVVVNHLPFVMDDTKHAKRPEDVAETIYSIAQGRGKGRGTIKGTASQETFATVAMSSGEQAATSFTKDGGTQARVITIWGSPFGCTSQAIAKLVRLLNDGIKRNYGHAGPRFVKFLLQNRKKWKKWRAMYEECVKAWEDEAGDNAIAGRLATPFAAISVAAILAHEAIDLPWEYDDPITPLWGELTREATDQAAAALQHVMGWANAHEAEFFGRRNDKLPPPTQGWAGRWDIFRASDDDIRWQWIGLFSHRLDEILHDGGFEPESTKRIWRDRGWLKVTKDRDGTIRTRCKVRIGEETPWLVLITKAAVKAAENKS